MLAHDDLGTGAPLVLLHAGVADRRMWSEHLQPLADAGFRAIALDLPGFGESPPAEVENAPWEDVAATMDALGIEKASLIGNSFGAEVALRVAVVAPERISSIVLVSALGPEFEPSPELEDAWAAEEAALELGDIEEAVRINVDTWTLADAPTELRERVAMMQRRALELQATAGAVPEATDPLEDEPELLTRVTAPAMVAVGEHDRPEIRSAAEQLSAVLSDSRPVVLAGAGHLAPLEQPRAFIEQLISFLRADAAAPSG